MTTRWYVWVGILVVSVVTSFAEPGQVTRYITEPRFLSYSSRHTLVQGPAGVDGAPATVSIGNVLTGEPGSSASVTNSGTESNAVLDITIPRGDSGIAGPTIYPGAGMPSSTGSEWGPSHSEATFANMSSHKTLTTSAHGGIVSSGDSRLIDARTPTTHGNEKHSANYITAADVVAPATFKTYTGAYLRKNGATAADQIYVSDGVGSWVARAWSWIVAKLGLGTAAYTSSTDYAQHAAFASVSSASYAHRQNTTTAHGFNNYTSRVKRTGDTMTGTLAISGASLNMSGNINRAAWTTNGVRIYGTPGTLTDTTSAGPVASAYTDVFGGNTIAATNTTTFTNYGTLFLKKPINGANVTIVNPLSLITDGQVNFGDNVGIGSGLTNPQALLSIRNNFGTPGVSSYPLIVSQLSGTTTLLAGIYATSEVAGGATGLAFKVFKDGVGYIEAARLLNSGYLGIGLTAPLRPLHVYGASYIDSDSVGGTQLIVRGASNTNQQLYVGYNTTSDYGVLQAIKQGSSYELIALNPLGGNVGIGLTALGTSAAKALGIGDGTAPAASVSGAQIWSEAATGLNIVPSGSYTAKTQISATNLTLPGKITMPQTQTISGSKTLTDNTATGIFEIALPTNSTGIGGYMSYSVTATDGSAIQAHSGYINIACIRDSSATVTSDIKAAAAGSEAAVATTPSLTENGWTITNGTGKCTINANFDSSLTSPTITLKYQLILHGSNTVTQL